MPRFGPIRNRGTPLYGIRRRRRASAKEAQAARHHQAERLLTTHREKDERMAQGQDDTKAKIIGLLEVRKHRGLEGRAAIDAWVINSLECLLQAELARIEKREKDAS